MTDQTEIIFSLINEEAFFLKEGFVKDILCIYSLFTIIPDKIKDAIGLLKGRLTLTE